MPKKGVDSKNAGGKGAGNKPRSDRSLMYFAMAFMGILIAFLTGVYVMKLHNGGDGVLSLLNTDQTERDGDIPIAASAQIPKGANTEGKPREAIRDCVDRHAECVGFQRNGECLRNPGWMIVNCPKSCDKINNACSLRDPKIRCNRKNLNISTEPIYRPGDLDKMFRAIPSRFGDRYNIKVLSESPWIVLFENFVSVEEGKALVSTIPKFERSTDTGSMNEYGETGRILSTGRTSSNGWCGDECLKHPKVRSVLRKIEEVTGVPRNNYESFQVLKYELGQRYTVHHDNSNEDRKLACGPRILTFFLYLSDVEEGGETNFPQVGVAVKPKRGNAILWPSVFDSDPEEQDPRTVHEAKPVIKGLKVAANSWIHLYDYTKSNLWGCTGSFDEL